MVLSNLIRNTSTRLGFEIFVKGCDSIRTTCQNVCSTVDHLKATNLVKMRSKLHVICNPGHGVLEL